MNNEWDEYAQGWDADPTVQEYANKAFTELTNATKLDGLSVFDFGCGTGALTKLMSPKVKEIVALDGSAQMIQWLNKKQLDNVTTIAGFLDQALIDTDPQLARKFDLIVASSVCSFLPEYEKTLALLKSLLQNNGMFVQWDWLAHNDNAEFGLSQNRVENALKSNGFVEVKVTTPFIMQSSKGSMSVLMAIAK